jgi:Divergent InlB B-repeat domain
MKQSRERLFVYNGVRTRDSEQASFSPRAIVALNLFFAGFLLAVAGFASVGGNGTSTMAVSGATIYVTSLEQKITGTGGCSLQEAIYSATLRANIAIDSTNPDHFIVTQCVQGTGNGDVIVLPKGGVFNLNTYLDGDAHNPYGPTATPIIFSTMTIEGAGATLQWTGGSTNVRLFAIGPASVNTPTNNGTVSGTGGLTLRNVYIKGFHVKGGDGGGDGGGGGLGAGGAIYLQNGTLIVENSTFDGNQATGGNINKYGNGGGGIWGNGGQYSPTGLGGGGGGGAKGNGGNGGDTSDLSASAGGGGGGTVFSGGNGNGDIGGAGGYQCGGNGGDSGNDGHNGSCPGGGGGGAGSAVGSENGGSGNYGGGGGGGESLFTNGHGGNGGFGGGGGGGGSGGTGGNGGFGGGAGAGDTNGSAGRFGGQAANRYGGAGAALGGAIFNDSGTVTIHNSTFTKNAVTGGSGAGGSESGEGFGGAIFSHGGSLTVVDTTISGNHSVSGSLSDVAGAGIYIDGHDSTASFILDDTILANNGESECIVEGSVTSAGAGNLIISNGSVGGFGACPGVVASTDPSLGALQPPSTNGGLTPTMAIPLYSSAMGVADPTTSFKFDQRNAPRPQADKTPRNGYDIGAFEVCRRFFGPTLEAAPCSFTTISPPPQVTLTMQASPSGDGTTNPAPGANTEDLNSVVPITATANSGFHFVNWTGPVTDPNNPSTTVTMTQNQTVTANFATGALMPTLTMQVSSVAEGSTSPAPGVHSETLNDVVPILAEPNTGYHFVSWTGNVADSLSYSTTVTMTQNQTVTANFAIGTPSPTPIPTPSPTATPTPTPTPTTLANISTRLRVETGDNVLIGGFIITGTQDKKVIVRAIGPSLPVPDALADPFLELHDGAGNLIQSNDNWVDSPNKQAIIDSTIPPSNDLESAIVATLPANSSAYTAIVRGVNDTTGVGLVEVYDLDQSVDSKLANISTRGFVETGDNVMIGGFIVLGSSSQNVIVRAIGPSLPVPGALADPTLELHNGNGDVIAFDDNWKDSQQAEIEATTIPPTNDLESAIVATLDPGNYTAIVRGVNDTTGVALIEVYALN